MSVHDIGESLRKTREEHNFKQREIAAALGIDRSTYSFYETGKTRPSLESVFALSKIYNITVDKLLGFDNENRADLKKPIERVAGNVDAIAFLSKQEQLLLMYYRLADDKKKEELIKFLNPDNKDNK